MNYLILGASGFIGKKIAKELIEEKGKIRLFDRNFSNFNNSDDEDGRFEFVSGIFSRDYDFCSLTKEIDVVFHLISTTIPSTEISFAQELDENVAASLRLFDACKINNVKKVIFISSGGTVYGKSLGKPFKEDDPTNPISSYGVQKLTIEKYLQLYGSEFGLDYRIVRLANPYGPGQNPLGSLGIITKFTYNIINDIGITVFGDGNIVRDYIYIDDAIKGILSISNYEGKNKLFNLGYGKGHSIIEIIEIIEQVSGKKFNIEYKESRDVDVDFSVLDIQRYLEITDNKNMISITDGVKYLIDYFLEVERNAK
ncbi:hypothetical protein BCR24_04430 [Enterococcus ureilyticus]|uniref:NAD-dependent epimerase/dehydratase domain-containing protein n=1 Tax=Enterococcus ureilyticus TaxID=1131292 RepID=A0A1E5HAW0_9ENTE|nr:NAD-dependent epimerase/dehydratase family protein [Enterococcus ureilyticus]MBM7688897.1 UDP-glucose 4-epimerase [Enterococcus ureilyticus]OEG21956.1 hypothetical protein BCR24_04430 [Enterococcus ureilyticus]